MENGNLFTFTLFNFPFQVVAGAHNRILEGGHQKRNIAKMEANANVCSMRDNVR